MAEEEGISGRRLGKHYRRILILAVVCFLVGIWLVSFPIFDFPWKDTAPFRLWSDFLALAGGVIMMALGFTLWKGGIS